LDLSGAKIRALACDYDGTLAHEGRVAEATTDALGRFKASGRRLLMVTGRELVHLREIYPYLGLFDAIVCENGAQLYQPDLEVEQSLAPGPPPAFIEALRARGVEPLNIGRSIVATTLENETRVLEVVEQQHNGWQVIRNKDSVMSLPAGVDKASGFKIALDLLGLDAAQVMGVGDAENDEAFIAACGVGAAVANALPALKAMADIVTRGADGAGVVELIDQVLVDAVAA